MALYTPPSLPHTPFSFAMNATLPPLPAELLSTWASWRHPKQELRTPSMSAAIPRRRTEPPSQGTTLPPIAHLDRHLPPLKPSYSEDVSQHRPSSSRLPPIQDTFPDMQRTNGHVFASDDFSQAKPDVPLEAPHLVDWLDFSRKRSAHFIAEKTCEMICYLWFANASSTPSSRSNGPSSLSPSLSRSTSATTALQLSASPTFVQFMQKLLETTQVSQSVIVLSLHYIYRLKERNRLKSGQPGSEFRIAVAGLMMANKFLDDNTYTNKTWSEVSGIDLADINKMEREFLVGIDFGLYVDESTYDSWLNLLKGLVMAKERDSRQYRRSRGSHRTSRPSNIQSSMPPSSRYSSRYRPTTHRARSTSPTSKFSAYPFSFAMSSASAPQPPDTADYSPTPLPAGSKRSAKAAFSPTSATFPELRPSKRPMAMSLQIPDIRAGSAPSSANSNSPLETLQGFAKMSLASSPAAPRPSQSTTPTWASSNSDTLPHTLVAAYRADERRPTALPESLYYYSLACSPMDNNEEDIRSRKARLRSYQPPPSTSTSYNLPHSSYPMNIQSASTSPRDVHMSTAPPTLPHFHDTVWSRQSVSYGSSYDHPAPAPQPPVLHDSPTPSAPFANAGPPGVQFYAIRTSPVYSYDWSRGRRL